MRPDVLDLKAFYETPLGAATTRAISRCLPRFRPDDKVLAIGYGLPYLAACAGQCARGIAAMPARQGAVSWPHRAAPSQTRVCLVDVDALPFPDGLFDHVLLIHCLEYSGRVRTTLSEATRVLTPSGSVHAVVPNRAGPWSRAERTPFGNGRPFSSGQLGHLLEDAHLAAYKTHMALMLPPLGLCARWMDRAEPMGQRLWPKLGGVYVVSARIDMLAGRRPKAKAVSGSAIRPPIFAPAPAPAARVSAPLNHKHGLLGGQIDAP